MAERQKALVALYLPLKFSLPWFDSCLLFHIIRSFVLPSSPAEKQTIFSSSSASHFPALSSRVRGRMARRGEGCDQKDERTRGGAFPL